MTCLTLIGDGLAWDRSALAAIGWALCCSALGLADDTFGLSAKVRFGVQVALAAVVAHSGLRWTAIDLGFVAIPLATPISYALTMLWLVWVVNLYNFMDGINGIATLSGIVLAGFLAFWSGEGNLVGAAFLSLMLAGSLAGFLPFNWPKALIFMGDAGSLFLGAFFGIMPLVLAKALPAFGFPEACAVIAMFLADSTVTLIYRMCKGERFTEAHRSHAYQRLAQSRKSHIGTALIFASGTLATGALAEVARRQAEPAYSWLGVLAATVFVIAVKAKIPLQK